MGPHEWKRVEELFHVALERAPGERKAFLAEACGGNEALRREVESLLAQEGSAERMMERPAASEVTQRAVVRGTRLGPYEVVDLLGAGGMGEVHRARDTRLGRDVAIKVLPADLASDAERLRRFEREARAVASLSHPHIASLFDVGHADGTHFLVMELVDGETLAARLKRKALAEGEALRIGTEIADALAAAHAHGIVHRDVKPANVMLTRAGAKLLDFGLARLQAGYAAAGATAATTDPVAGVMAGTLPYMAPEQLEGRAADARSDIWALGCVLFEMLTGTRAFHGDTPARLVAAIEKDDPPSVLARRPGTSPGLDRLIRQCLQKDTDERWSSAHDLALRLREIAETGHEPARPGGRTNRWRVAVVALLAVAVGLAGLLAVWRWLRVRPPAPPAGVVRSEIDLGAERPLRVAWYHPHAWSHPIRTELALSPDGTRLVWAAAVEGKPSSVLFQRRIDTGEVTRIPGTEGASQPFFSPDGRWIGFCAEEGRRFWLRKVRVDGGLPVDLAEFQRSPMGISWGSDGGILFGAEVGGVQRVSADGGPPSEVTTADSTREAGHRLPRLLPGGRALLFTTMPTLFGSGARIEVARLPGGERRVLVENGADGRYLPPRHLVFVRRGALMAAPFDLDRLELTGTPAPVVHGVSQALNTGASDGNSAAAQYALSESGLLAYAPGGIRKDQPIEPVAVDWSGRVEPLPGFDKPLVSPQFDFSPDGRLMAFVERESSGLLWLFDLERHTHRALSDRGLASSPRWSPDGTRLVASWTEAGPFHLWLLPTTGGEWEQLTGGAAFDWTPSWSPDGRLLAFLRGSVSPDILLYRLEDRRVVPFLDTPARELWPDFSPDGRWLAYGSDETGRFEVYVTSVPDRQRTFAVSHEGGGAPAWSRDGRRLFYLSLPSADGRQSMMSVTVRDGATLSLGRPTLLCRLPEGFVFLGPMRSYALHPDGKRFVVGRRVQAQPTPPITRLTLVENWSAELDRLAPPAR